MNRCFQQVAALENEIYLMQNLAHERVVEYVGMQRDEQSICIFMEYMPGGSVRDAIRQFGKRSYRNPWTSLQDPWVKPSQSNTPSKYWRDSPISTTTKSSIATSKVSLFIIHSWLAQLIVLGTNCQSALLLSIFRCQYSARFPWKREDQRLWQRQAAADDLQSNWSHDVHWDAVLHGSRGVGGAVQPVL